MAVGYALIDMWKEMQVEVKGVENVPSEPVRKVINPCPKCGSNWNSRADATCARHAAGQM